MAHGLKILTRDGLTDISTIRSSRLIQTSNQTTSSGSINTPAGSNGTNSFAFAVSNDGLAVPPIVFSLAANVLTWDANVGSETSSDFTINVIRFA